MHDAARSGKDEGLFDDSLTARLDEIIDSGLLFVVNSEAAVLDRMRALGCKSYDQAKHRALIERNQETSIFVDNLMQNALRGKSVDSGAITHLVTQYLADMTEDLDSTLASVLETVKDRAIAAHCVKVALLGMAIGIEMRYDAANIRNLAVAAMVHDWGMARVASEILEAGRRLTEAEFFEIKKHPIHSMRLLERLPGIPNVVPLIAYQVHERPNGSGYPNGRTGDRIHPMAKILNVADAYHALTSPRPFRPPLMPYAAMECLLRQAGAGDVDPEPVRALLRVQSLFPIGSYVALTDGRVARVLRRNGEHYARPIVRLLQDSEGNAITLEGDAAIVDLEKAGLDVMQALPTPGRQEIELNPQIMERPCWGSDSLAAAREPTSSGAIGGLFVRQKPVLRSSADEDSASLERYTEKQKRQAKWALEMLDHSSGLADKQYQHCRKHGRQTFRSVVRVCVPNTQSAVLDAHGAESFRAIARDVSPGGLSFIHPAQLTVDNLIIGVEISGNEVRWFHAEVARRREIAEADFWEYGVAFRRRLVL